jgi:hypothetical protein
MAATTSDMILAAYRSRLLASSPTTVSRSAFWHSSPIDGSEVLAITDVMGSSTWRAGATTLWIASVEDTTALTYDFHATHDKTSLCKNRFRIFPWILHIPNMFIYMSFRVAQDHNKAVGRDTTSLTPSWTQQHDPTATTRCRSFSFICISNCLELANNCLELLNLLFCFLLFWTWMSCYYVYIPVYSAYFEGSLSGQLDKIGSSKNK